ncbi:MULTISPECIES: LysM peptidoglycan-binding domain-containing protein [unclassified Arthrobacter]|uniref:C40 family peptidase n=1 Tax=unclassified Arthrobacter TaxID=235627 RepID=UPI0014930B75|nr:MULTISPECIES: LysM peptidoglycan-binding domain-containing protein [unclassified Arthrobacter]MBE0010157.1 LysM peptidoglycan-binding domain-containing protein [Arthrobacter sp. AET 35A]NOJ64059.1 LysM peptidoglycan-binding domain-containing protein [Arthrobacter sp. 147(2020)]
MSRKTISARHRAATTHSVALKGLSYSAKANAVALGKPAIIAAATGSLVFSFGATAQAGTYTQEAANTAQAPAVSAPAAPVAAPAGTNVYTVVSGDTMGAIAARHGISLDALLGQNGLSYASVIFPGQQIQLSGGASGAANPATVPAAPASQVFAPAPAAESAVMSLASGSITPIAPKSSSSVPASGVGAALVASAYGQLGAIQDCTILVEQALRSIGLNVGDLGPLQFDQYGTRVSTPAPGDLVVRPGHIAIYVGNGKVISSGMNGSNQTIEHPLSDLAGSYFVRVNG